MDSTALKSLARAVISTEATAIASLESRIDDTFVAACKACLIFMIYYRRVWSE